MTQTTARIKKAGKHFEILVDLEEAMKFKKASEGNENVGATDFLEIDVIYSDAKKGEKAQTSQIEEAFGTSDVNKVAEDIVKKGEVLKTQDYRDTEKENKIKRLVDFLVNNSIDPQTGNPHTTERIKNALEEANINIKDKSIDSQIDEVVEELNKILPIKIEKKKVKITIPAMHVGKSYGVINPYKESEEWKSDGSLEVIVSVPSGRIMDFYDQLNSVTHGSALTEEI